MSIHRVKNKGAYCFSFKRTINGRLIRATKLLPAGWNEEQAFKFDKVETARLYALHMGLDQPKADRPLIADAVLLYLENHVPQLKTSEDYIKEYFRQYPFYHGKYLDELPAVCAELNKLPLSAGSRRNKIRMLCAACNYAFKFHNLGEHPPSARVQVPVVRNNRTTVPTRKEMLQIARRCRRRDTRAAIITAYYSGMRQGEIRSATLSDGVFKLFDTKNGSPRYVPVHPRLLVYSKQFPMDVKKTTLYEAWKAARDGLKLSHLHFHDLRHSAASEMANSGVDLHTVGLVLGHKDTRSTARYSHLYTDTLLSAIKKIGLRARKDIP